VRYSVLLYMPVDFVFLIIHNFFHKPLYSLSFSNGPYYFVVQKSMSTHTIQLYTAQTHQYAQWQFGSGIVDNAYMGAVAREFSCVFGIADTSS